MFDFLTIVAVVAGFAFIIVVGAKLGAGSPDSFADLLASPTMPPRPHGVQETDVPRFVFRDPKVTGTGPA